MSEQTLVQRVWQAALVLEELKLDPSTHRSAYTPEDLRAILRMFQGA